MTAVTISSEPVPRPDSPPPLRSPRPFDFVRGAKLRQVPISTAGFGLAVTVMRGGSEVGEVPDGR